MRLLLLLQERELALQKAVDSNDTNLIYLALLHLERSVKSDEEFHRLIFKHPNAVKLMTVYLRAKGGAKAEKQLQALYYYPGNYLEAGNMAVGIAYQQPDLTVRRERLKLAVEMFQQSKELAFHAKATDEQIELLQEQERLETATGHNCFVDTSVSDTIHNLVCLAAENPSCLRSAAHIKKNFRVPDKRFWHLQVRAMAETGQWDNLASLASERKQPIGFRPFAEACHRHGNLTEAERYCAKITQVEDRYECLARMQMWQAAADVAFKMKDGEKLESIKMQCQDVELKTRIAEMAAQLGLSI